MKSGVIRVALVAVAVLGVSTTSVGVAGASNDDSVKPVPRAPEVQRALENADYRADIGVLLRNGSFTSDPASSTTSSGQESETVEQFVSDAPTASAPRPATDGRLEPSSLEGSGCYYDQVVDYAHKSGGDVSTHGWWNDNGGSCPLYANVDVWLQAYYCDSWGCGFVTVAYDSKDKRARNIWNEKLNVRKACNATHNVSWRSQVDVDLIGQSDPGGRTTSPSQVIFCSPS